MKSLFICTLLLASSVCSAQKMDYPALVKLIKSKKVTLESNYVGLSNKEVAKQLKGKCESTMTKKQSIIKEVDDQYLIFTTFALNLSGPSDCKNVFDDGESLKPMLMLEPKLKVEDIIEQLDEVQDQLLIERKKDLITMSSSKNSTILKYDLTKPFFNFDVFTQSRGITLTKTDEPDLKIKGLDLSDVNFCEVNVMGELICKDGDYSHLLKD